MPRDFGFDFSNRDYSWDDVLDSLEVASTDHETKMNRSRTKKFLGNKAIVTTLESLADTIPDQDGLSVLRGGLKLVFSVGSSPIRHEYAINVLPATAKAH